MNSTKPVINEVSLKKIMNQMKTKKQPQNEVAFKILRLLQL